MNKVALASELATNVSRIGHLGDALGLRWVPSFSTGRKELAVEAGNQDATRTRERSPPKGVTTLAIRAVIETA